MNIILFDKDCRSFTPEDEAFSHIKNVLHLKEGDSFVAGEFNGSRGRALIRRMDENVISFSFEAETQDGEMNPVTLILALVRPICMRRMLRELVALGVERLVLTSSDLGEKSYASSTLYTTNEYMTIMKRGAMQSGHTGLSEATFAKNVEEAIGLAGFDRLPILLDNVVGSKRFKDLDLNVGGLTLAVGPERGWSERERALFLSAGYIPVEMGKRILRSETACLCSVMLALEALGRI